MRTVDRRRRRATRARVVAAGALMLAVLVGSACSSSSSSSQDGAAETPRAAAPAGSDAGAPGEGAAGLPDPCTLLTTADIESASGVQFGDATPNDVITGEDRAACDWVSTGDEFATAQVLVYATSAGGYEEARSGAESAFGLDVTDVSVPGVSRAYAVEGGVIVGMDLGDTFLQVSFLPSDDHDVTDITTQLAAKAVGRLS